MILATLPVPALNAARDTPAAAVGDPRAATLRARRALPAPASKACTSNWSGRDPKTAPGAGERAPESPVTCESVNPVAIASWSRRQDSASRTHRCTSSDTRGSSRRAGSTRNSSDDECAEAAFQASAGAPGALLLASGRLILASGLRSGRRQGRADRTRLSVPITRASCFDTRVSALLISFSFVAKEETIPETIPMRIDVMSI